MEFQALFSSAPPWAAPSPTSVALVEFGGFRFLAKGLGFRGNSRWFPSFFLQRVLSSNIVGGWVSIVGITIMFRFSIPHIGTSDPFCSWVRPFSGD